MSDRECRRVDADVAEFLAAARSVSAVTVDISRGDIVWDGRHAVVVAVRSA